MDETEYILEAMQEAAHGIHGKPFEELTTEQKFAIAEGIYSALNDHYEEVLYWRSHLLHGL